MSLKLTQLPTLDQLTAYSVNRPGQLSGLRWELYDFQTYAAAGVTQQDFFQVPQGQSSKTLADTNMEAAGTLPNPKAMLVTDIQIFFTPTGDISAAAAVSEQANDVRDFYMGAAYLEFFIGSTNFVQQGPLVRFPPRNGLVGWSDVGTGAFMVNYTAAGGAPYLVEPQIKLEPTQNFKVSLKFPVAIPTATTARVGVVLGGYQYRLSQ
jgi:hypothetical protein